MINFCRKKRESLSSKFIKLEVGSARFMAPFVNVTLLRVAGCGPVGCVRSDNAKSYAMGCGFKPPPGTISQFFKATQRYILHNPLLFLIAYQQTARACWLTLSYYSCCSSVPICRLWAEVFHVTTSSSGSVKWSQVQCVKRSLASRGRKL